MQNSPTTDSEVDVCQEPSNWHLQERELQSNESWESALSRNITEYVDTAFLFAANPKSASLYCQIRYTLVCHLENIRFLF